MAGVTIDDGPNAFLDGSPLRLVPDHPAANRRVACSLADPAGGGSPAEDAIDLARPEIVIGFVGGNGSERHRAAINVQRPRG
jgi:hypothetical protein